MTLSLEQVRHIAHLARLRLTDEEERRFQDQLSDILDYADRLQEIDTEAIPPTATVLNLRAPLRPDEPRPSPAREDILRNAAASEGGMFRVPPVLNGDD